MKFNFTKAFRKRLLKKGLHGVVKGKVNINPLVKLELPCDIGDADLSQPLEIGAYTYIGSGFRNRASVKIGRLCSIANDLVIIDGNHALNTVSTSPFFMQPFYGWNKKLLEEAPVKAINYNARKYFEIGDDVWIGVGVKIIGEAIKIGRGAVVGAGAVVTKDVPDYAVVAGVPAKILKYREIKPYDYQEVHQKTLDEILKKDFPVMTQKDFFEALPFWKKGFSKKL